MPISFLTGLRNQYSAMRTPSRVSQVSRLSKLSKGRVADMEGFAPAHSQQFDQVLAELEGASGFEGVVDLGGLD